MNCGLFMRNHPQFSYIARLKRSYQQQITMLFFLTCHLFRDIDKQSMFLGNRSPSYGWKRCLPNRKPYQGGPAKLNPDLIRQTVERVVSATDRVNAIPVLKNEVAVDAEDLDILALQRTL
ncbi:hypothetical protein CA11_54580 [Gimesia maris]|nr:hypothetical protein CA11_54580 [Gimesia maris]